MAEYADWYAAHPGEELPDCPCCADAVLQDWEEQWCPTDDPEALPEPTDEDCGCDALRTCDAHKPPTTTVMRERLEDVFADMVWRGLRRRNTAVRVPALFLDEAGCWKVVE